MKGRVVFAALMIFATALPALAGVGIGPQVGYYNSSDADEGSYLFGGALRLKPIPFLGDHRSAPTSPDPPHLVRLDDERRDLSPFHLFYLKNLGANLADLIIHMGKSLFQLLGSPGGQ